ncbi:hypothetical protein [Sphingomonas soli]|uniref:hypothetical protein n=1 Tax=Sphingomonas soli TaxID=266127 RepID=UPI00082B48D3|nr:hypothetical protein [Sphingomonas soli]
MADLLTLYREHAERAQADADAATLGNVRERNLRAADAWRQMAERIERTETARATREPHGDPALRAQRTTP